MIGGTNAELRQRIAALVADQGMAGLIEIIAVKGSAPRDIGTCMALRPDGGFIGTIGGGALEWQALAEMRRALARMEADSPALPFEHDYALGPELGQCCGGRVRLRFSVLTRATLTHAFAQPDDQEGPTPLCLFGAGHVGRALVLALAPLPFTIRWIDPRREAFPAVMPRQVVAELHADPVAAVQSLSAGSLVVIMTHDHALDLALCDAALRQPDCAFVGLIGSVTKRARFLGRLRDAGIAENRLERLACPIGDRRIGSKEPAAIAAGIVVQLLLERERLAAKAPVGQTAVNQPLREIDHEPG